MWATPMKGTRWCSHSGPEVEVAHHDEVAAARLNRHGVGESIERVAFESGEVLRERLSHPVRSVDETRAARILT